MAKSFGSASTPAEGLSKHTRYTLLACTALTLAVFYVPYGHIIGYPLFLISTLVHEMGHGLTALALGGNFHSFKMWEDGSGVADISGHYSRFSAALIAAGGLVGPAVAAAISFLAAKKAAIARLFLSALGVLLIVAEFLFVRNFFAIFFVAVLAAIFLWLAQQSRPWLAQASLVFVAIQLALSVFSRSDYLFTKTAVTAQGSGPSDVAAIADALLLPYWFWGALCALFSVIVLVLGLWSYLRK